MLKCSSMSLQKVKRPENLFIMYGTCTSIMALYRLLSAAWSCIVLDSRPSPVEHNESHIYEGLEIDVLVNGNRCGAAVIG